MNLLTLLMILKHRILSSPERKVSMLDDAYMLQKWQENTVYFKWFGIHINKELFAYYEFENLRADIRPRSNTPLSPEIQDTLLPFQITHAQTLTNILEQNQCVIDASDTGTGKTYCAIAVAKHLNLIPVVVAPLSIITTWQNVMKLFNLAGYVNNIEQLKTGKTPYVKKQEPHYVANLKAEKHIVIFDEAHNLKNPYTQNSKMAGALIATGAKCMMLSATLAEKAQDLYRIGKALHCFVPNRFVRFYSKYSCPKLLHEVIFKTNRGSRIKKSQSIGFAQTRIITDCITISETKRKEIASLYAEIQSLIEEREKYAEQAANIFPKIMYARQAIELIKTKAIRDMTHDVLCEGNAPVVFLNFKESVRQLSILLKQKKIAHAVITGDVSPQERGFLIDDFQHGRIHTLLLTVATGGQSISLHDVHATRPRYSIISPSYSAIHLKQCLGRIDRIGAMSTSTQRIVYVHKTIEERVASIVKKKIACIDTLNNGDFLGL